MEKRTKKETVGVLLLLGVFGLPLLYSVVDSDSRTGVLSTAASGQNLPVVTPAPTQAATAAYVKFDGVNGESQDRDHKDWINLLSFNQGQYLPPSSAGPGGGSRGVVVFEEVTLKKELDKASPKLAESVCTGKVFPKVDIHVARTLSGETKVTYYTCELTNVQVTSYHIGGSTQDVIPVEEVSLNFEEIKVTYTKLDATGTPEENVEYSWNIARNRP